jgi:DNA mismatch repair protein MutS2
VVDPGGVIPDLLHATPRERIDVEHTRLAIALAFASGVAGGLFGDALDRASVAPSSWQPAQFASDLFIHQFVALCFRFKVGSADAAISITHLVNLLTHPPSDRATLDHRRAIADELTKEPALRSALEQLYTSLTRFRGLLEGGTGIGKWDSSRRQLDILAVIKEILDQMATGFVSAKSGLAILHAFGTEVQKTEPYRSLADLLRYEERLATLNLKVTVGADGRIRGFQILSIQENDENAFVNSAPRRWLSKVELFVRGFHFSDGEVIARLIDAVFEGLAPDIVRLVQLLGDIELYLGALAFRDRAIEAGLSVSLPAFASPKEPRKLEKLFNPLLLAHGMKPVPCDVHVDPHDAIVLVTGPNSGGKTRLLQSMALTQLLAQCGLFIPAKEGTVALVPALVVSLIQETKADQVEGRLGMELVRIRALFEQLPPGAMVVLDELCSGTNPSEGEEIFELVIRMLTRLEPQTFITTHFLAFAARLEQEKKIDGLRFLQVVLGPNHEPTYQFAPGVAHTSLAGHAAARLGVTGDQLLALIERNIAANTKPNP